MMHMRNAACGKHNFASQKGNLWQAEKYAINYESWKIKLHVFLCVFTVTIHGECMRKKVTMIETTWTTYVCTLLKQVPET